MNRLLKRRFPVMTQSAWLGGVTKYDYDFTALGDGALPFPWVGSTFAISTAKLINTPTLGPEILTDPGLEATYTDGLCGTLTKTGAPTVADGAPDVHGGSHSQSFANTNVGQQIEYPTITNPTAHSWYYATLWHKMTVGAKDSNFNWSVSHGGGTSHGQSGSVFTGSDWTQKKVSQILFVKDWTYFVAAYNYSADAHTVLVDDGSLKKITSSTLFAMLPQVSRMATVKIQPSAMVDQTISGAVAWANSQTDPTYYLLATVAWRYNEIGPTIGLVKFVNGTGSQLIAPTYAGEVTDAWVEIRPTDNTHVGVYYNNTQIGSDVEVTDVPGAYPGIVISGGNNVKGFFAG